eukprot:149053_1
MDSMNGKSLTCYLNKILSIQTYQKDTQKKILKHKKSTTKPPKLPKTTINDCTSIKHGCMATQRMINALIYYSTLTIDYVDRESDKIHPITATNSIQIIDDLIMIFTHSNEVRNIKQTDKDKFMKYIIEIYHQFLDDYIHIMDKHNNDIEEISESMVRDFSLMNTCD